MDMFVIGVASAIFMYLASYSYLTTSQKVWYTDNLVGPVLDISFFVACMGLNMSTGGGLFFAFGLSVGFSLVMRLCAWLNVHFRVPTQ